jgi:hypothetical protein
MNKINPLSNERFPASRETWDFVKQMILCLEKVVNLGGSRYIISGCIDQGDSVSDGHVVINGEIFPFIGGAKSTYVIIQETVRGVDAGGVTYAGVYTERVVRFGNGAGQLAWSSFKNANDLLTKIEGKLNKGSIVTANNIFDYLNTGLPSRSVDINLSAFATSFDVAIIDLEYYWASSGSASFQIRQWNGFQFQSLNRTAYPSTNRIHETITLHVPGTPSGKLVGLYGPEVFANLRLKLTVIGVL